MTIKTHLPNWTQQTDRASLYWPIMYKYTYNELACLFSDFAMVVWLLKTETVFKCLEFESSLQRFYIVTLSDIFLSARTILDDWI